MSKDEGRLIVYLADPIIRVGKEYSPCALFFGVFITSNSQRTRGG